MEWGGKWDNCNSIINKYIKKNLKKRKKKNSLIANLLYGFLLIKVVKMGEKKKKEL